MLTANGFLLCPSLTNEHRREGVVYHVADIQSVSAVTNRGQGERDLHTAIMLRVRSSIGYRGAHTTSPQVFQLCTLSGDFRYQLLQPDSR